MLQFNGLKNSALLPPHAGGKIKRDRHPFPLAGRNLRGEAWRDVWVGRIGSARMSGYRKEHHGKED
jgi:hypothetical protein